MEFSERLKQIRIENKMTQEEVAKALYVRRQTISKWEKGITEPDLETLERISKLFNVSIDELIGEKKETQKNNLAFQILFLISTCILIINIITLLIYLKFLPNQIPMHYDSKFNVDRYGSKYETLLFIPCYLLYYIPSLVGLYYLKKKSGKKINQKNLTIILPSLSIFLESAFGIFIICLNSKYLVENSVFSIIIAECGVIILIASLLIHPKINKNINTLIGIRTEFSLENKQNWYKMNRFGSYSFFISSIAMIILATLLDISLFYLSFIPLVLSIISIFIYELIVKRKQN